jgi:hypothetical protein
MPGEGRKLYRETAVSYTRDSSVQYMGKKTVRISVEGGENIRRRR